MARKKEVVDISVDWHVEIHPDDLIKRMIKHLKKQAKRVGTDDLTLLCLLSTMQGGYIEDIIKKSK